MNRIAPFVGSYALAHLVVDAACAFLVLGVLDIGGQPILSLLIYNGLAFVLQVPLGVLVDKFNKPKFAVLFGIMLVACSFLFWNSLLAALLLAGVGNALFHVGGGSLILSLEFKKATYAGLFVAPGGIGLAIGTYLSLTHLVGSLLFFPMVLIVVCLVLFFIKIPTYILNIQEKETTKWCYLIVSFILIPVIIRSLVGLSMDFPWKEHPNLLWMLTAAIALGKVFGGMLSDKFGLVKVGVGGMLVSAPLLAFFHSVPLLGMLGACVLNFTMPVTLVAIWSLMPKRRGLSFGLTTAALFIGALPVILGKTVWFQANSNVFTLLIYATIVLFATLYMVEKRNNLKT